MNFCQFFLFHVFSMTIFIFQAFQSLRQPCSHSDCIYIYYISSQSLPVSVGVGGCWCRPRRRPPVAVSYIIPGLRPLPVSIKTQSLPVSITTQSPTCICWCRRLLVPSPASASSSRILYYTRTQTPPCIY